MPSREPEGRRIRAARGLVLGLALLAAPGVAAADRSSVAGYTEAVKAAIAHPPGDLQFLRDLEQRLIDLTAERRHAAGAPPLQPDYGLRTAARAHALDMLERRYFDHVGPDGRDVGDRVAILDRRFIGTTGENLAHGNGHRDRDARLAPRGDLRGSPRSAAPRRAHLHVGRIDPEVGPIAFDRPLEESPHALVDLRAQPRNLAFGDG